MSFQSWQVVGCTHTVIPQVIPVVSHVTQFSTAFSIKITTDAFQLPQMCLFETEGSKNPSHYLRIDTGFFRLIALFVFSCDS